MPVRIKLDSIIEGLEFQSDEGQSYLNKKTGEVIFITDEEMRAAEDGDPMDAIADWYYSQILCPRMFDAYPERLDSALDIARRADVGGVVLQSIRNCDLHGIDNVMLEKDFEKEGIPVLVLEREYDALADA